MKNDDNIIVLNNKLFDIGPERNIMRNMFERVKAIFPSRNLVNDNAQTVRSNPPKPRKDEPQKSFKEILDEVKTNRDRDEVFISAEGKESFKVNKDNKECNHDLNDVNNTLKVLPKRTMVVPDTRLCSCNICKGTFEFVRNMDNKIWEDKVK